MIGSARDVVEHCGVPRFLCTDFPLGNPCGHPGRRDMQRSILRQALSLLETAAGPRMTVIAPFALKEAGAVWRPRYNRIDPVELDRLRALGDERRRRQQARKAKPISGD
ncbi:MAG: hypothetical protein AB7H90_24640 [Alphaproteobacteria bacterium]